MSDYIMSLRKTVGHRPLMQTGASVLVVDREGRLLLEKRADTHDWSYPGGSVELYEKTEDAAARELEEETGIIALSLKLMYDGFRAAQDYEETVPEFVKNYKNTLDKR